MTRRSEDTVRRVLGRFLHQGLDAVPRRSPPGRAVQVTEDWLAELERVIDLDPHEVGVDGAAWTTRLLSGYLQQATGHHAAIETVRMVRVHMAFVRFTPHLVRRWHLYSK